MSFTITASILQGSSLIPSTECLPLRTMALSPAASIKGMPFSVYIANRRGFSYKKSDSAKESLTYLKKKCVDFQRPLQNETLF